MTINDQDRLVRKAVRARSLVDPLGAMGYRTTSTRVDREARWRRAAFASTGACFAGVLSSILIGSGSGGLMANLNPTSGAVSQFVGTTSMVQPTSIAPSTTRYFEDEDEEYDSDDGPAQTFQAPAQDAFVTAPQAPSQPSHGRTGGS